MVVFFIGLVVAFALGHFIGEILTDTRMAITGWYINRPPKFAVTEDKAFLDWRIEEAVGQPGYAVTPPDHIIETSRGVRYVPTPPLYVPPDQIEAMRDWIVNWRTNHTFMEQLQKASKNDPSVKSYLNRINK